MKKFVYTIFLMAIIILSNSCTERIEPVTPRDWDNTTYLFTTEDEPQSLTYYKPYSGFIGDPMPFFDPVSKKFIVSYLQEYRPNLAGTYHPIWAVCTEDAVHYESLGEIIPCGGITAQDAALGTGSVIWSEEQQLYYFFYTGNKYLPSASENAEAVQYATSPDFKTWTKNELFVLRGNDYGYSQNDFRDPEIFRTDDGVYHMIVATKVGSKGTLAEFTSTDLQAWTSAGAFMNMMYADRFYECPNVFKMGDWWYLVYSEKHAAIRKVQYFKGKTLDALKACTANDAGIWPDDHEGFLDSRGLYAGKTASNGTDRYLWGWCPTRSGKDNTKTDNGAGEPDWAGSLVAHKLIQHADGSLTLGPAPLMAERYNLAHDVKVMRQQGTVAQVGEEWTLSGDANILLNRLERHNHLHMVVTTATAEDKFAISLCRGTKMTSDADSSVYYSLVVNPEGATTRKINFEQEGEGGKGFIADIDSYMFRTPTDNVYEIDIFTDNSVMVMYINDVLCYTNRVYCSAKNCWSINSYGTASISVRDLRVSYY